MKTRRIFLQPGEPVEIINPTGTSVLKCIAPYSFQDPCVVIYEQPGILTLTPEAAKCEPLSNTPQESARPGKAYPAQI